MSGEVAYLRASRGSFFARAFAELGGLPPATVRWALIGGLAVGARLAVAHRSTTDVDAVSAHPEELVEMLVRSGGVKSRGYVKFAGVPIEPLPVPGEGAGELPAARLWAYEQATPLRIVVRGDGEEVLAAADVAVATVAGLVLLKAESAVHAFDRSPAKRATDVYDVLRLGSASLGAVTAEIAAAPQPLLIDAAECIRERLVQRPAETLRHLTDAQREEFSVDDMRFYGEKLADLLLSR